MRLLSESTPPWRTWELASLAYRHANLWWLIVHLFHGRCFGHHAWILWRSVSFLWHWNELSCLIYRGWVVVTWSSIIGVLDRISTASYELRFGVIAWLGVRVLYINPSVSFHEQSLRFNPASFHYTVGTSISVLSHCTTILKTSLVKIVFRVTSSKRGSIRWKIVYTCLRIASMWSVNLMHRWFYETTLLLRGVHLVVSRVLNTRWWVILLNGR